MTLSNYEVSLQLYFSFPRRLICLHIVSTVEDNFLQQKQISLDDEKCLQGIVKDPNAPNGVLIEPSTTLT